MSRAYSKRNSCAPVTRGKVLFEDWDLGMELGLGDGDRI